MSTNKDLLQEIKDAKAFLKRTSANQDSNKYVTNEELRIELKKSHENGKATHRLHMMLFLIPVKLSNHSNFYFYSIKYDMIKEAYIQNMKSWEKFDLERVNEHGNLMSAFSYFTQISWYKFIELINKLYKKKLNLETLRIDGKTGEYYNISETDLELEKRKRESEALRVYNKGLSDW